MKGGFICSGGRKLKDGGGGGPGDDVLILAYRDISPTAVEGSFSGAVGVVIHVTWGQPSKGRLIPYDPAAQFHILASLTASMGLGAVFHAMSRDIAT